MLELQGLQTISLNRKTQRGGGVAFVYNTEYIDLEDINVTIPFNLEILWRLGKIKLGAVRQIILGVFYYPPRSKKKEKFINHMISTIHTLLLKYPRAEICLGGDKNELNISDILNSVPGLRLVQTPPTHKAKAIDIMMTTLTKLYKQPEIVAPLKSDNVGKPSDHKILLFYPIDNRTQIRKSEYVIKTARPMPKSKILSFKIAIGNINFQNIYDEQDPDTCDDKLLNILKDTLQDCIPEKNCKIKTNR